MRIVPVPCLQDNYAYLVICEASRRAAVVDPSEARPVLAAADREGVTIVAIWNTHHHWDHTGGNADLVSQLPDLEVVGHVSDEGRIPKLTRKVDERAQITVGSEVRAMIVYNPGHTTGAISYHIPSYPAVLTGDTLFLGGCGRLFEGDADMMHTSMQKLAALPADTQVFCGHEYTAANLTFAAAVEPDNGAIAQRREALRTPSVPGTLADELATNPFLRVGEPTVIAAAREHGATDESPAAVFHAIRQWKDGFKG